MTMFKRFVTVVAALVLVVTAGFAQGKELPKVYILATGGTIEAIIKLVESLGGEVVKIVFLMELAGLEGRKKLAGYDVASAIVYEGK